MRNPLVTIACLCWIAAPVWGQDGQRYAERTPLPHRPVPHTLARAGNPDTVARWAIPSVRSKEAGGYVGGASLWGNRLFSRGLTANAGAMGYGTYGTDYVGIRIRPGRIFLGASANPAAQPIAQRYRSQAWVQIPDVVNVRPVRKAILALQEAKEERLHGGHGEHSGGHAPHSDSGHGAGEQLQMPGEAKPMGGH